MPAPKSNLSCRALSIEAEALRLSPVCLAVWVASGLAVWAGEAAATPQNGVVTSGTATILTPKPGQMEIRQGSDTASIDWRSFSIGSQESLRVVQPSSQSVLVNRVIGDDPSQILGRLDANGRVFLSNPRGIVFGRDARVDVGGLLATTLAISGSGSQYSLSGSSDAPGSIVVEGQLRAPVGLLAFAGPQITLGGQLEAQRVAAAAVNAVHIDIDGDGLVFFKPRNDEQLDAKLKVLGSIKADGGVVDLRAAARAGLADTVLNMDGLVQARSIGTRNGQVVINGGAVGDTVVTGKIDVSGTGAGERGGDVRVLGQRVGLFGSALIDASGAAGGGLVHVGGGFQGQGEPQNSSMTVMGTQASIQASATDKGDGGQVVVWADGHTTFAGSIEARGGVDGGHGGRVETSGKQTLNFKGRVNTMAPHGKTGTLLLDPSDITISTGANDADDDGIGGFTGSADSSVLNTTTLQNALASNNVTVDATAGGAGGSGSITVANSVSWSSVKSLTLKASSTITVDTGAAIANTNTGGLNLFTDGNVVVRSPINLVGGAFTVRGTNGVTSASSFLANSGGAITTSGGANGAGGAIDIKTSGNLTTLALTANGGAATGNNNGGAAGAVILNSGQALALGGAISSAGGAGSGSGTVGNGGQVTLSAGGLLSQSGVITASSLSVSNTSAATNLSSSVNQVGTLGTINAAGQSFSFRNGLAITQSGPIQAAAATFSAGNNPITLTHGSNNFTGAVSLSNSGANNVQLTDANALTLGTLNVAAGNLTVTSTGALNLGTGTVGGNLVAASNGGAITQTAGGLSVGGNSNLQAGAAAITLTESSNNFTDTVSLSNSGANNVQLTDANALTLGTLSVAAGNLTVTSTGALNLGTGTVGGNLVAASNGGAIAQTAGGLTVGGSSSLQAGAAAITLTESSNDFSGGVSLSNTGANHVQVTDTNALTLGTLNVASGNLTVNSSGALNLGTGTVGGNLVAASNGGAITQTPGGLTVGGSSSLQAGTAAITLTESGNNFSGAVSLSNTGANHVQVTDTNALTLGTLNVAAGNLTVSSTGALNLGTGTVGGNLIATSNGGAITQTAGGLTVGGSSSLQAGTAAITLTESGNNFSGAVSLSNIGANHIQVTDTSALTLGTLNVAAGNLTVSSTGALNLGTGTVGGNLVAASNGGAITQTAGGLAVGGSSNLQAGAAAITLTESSNNFSGAVNLSNTGANHIQVTDTSALTLGTLNVAAGNLTVSSTGALNLGTGTVGGNLVAASNGGAITQTAGGLTVGGSSNLQAGAAAITLTENANSFAGAVSLNTSGSAAAAIKSGSLNLATSTVGGALAATATTGGITQSGVITLGADGNSFSATAANQSITLNAANVFGSNTVALNSGADASITADTLKFAASSIGGKLIATASTGSITQTGVLNLGADGNSFTTSTANQAITLTAANQFNGKTVALNTSGGSGHASLSGQALKFATSAIGGTLTANASNGGISQSGAISTGAAGNSFSVSTGQSIDLSTQANSLAGLVNGSDVFNTQGDLGLRNLAGIQLGSTTVSGKLVLSSDTGAISQTGAFNVGADGSSFTASSAGQAVTLSSANVFNGKTIAIHSGADASITADALKFASSTIAGKLIATATSGSITQTGALSLGADGNSFSTSGASQAITLNAANLFGSNTVAFNSSADTSITADTLKFATSSIAGKLVATATSGSITQTGALTLGADGNSFTTSGTSQAITLNAANAFAGKTVALNSSADASITADTLKFAASTISGKLVATASTGSITQTGALNLGADGNSFSTSAGQTITLGSANQLNNKTVALSSGGDATISADALEFAASTVSGKLVATSNSGSITQTGVLNLGADGNSFSSAQAITLGSANVLNGKTVALTSSADASISADALKFATSSIGGKLIATASTGTITQTGALNLGADGNSFTTSTANQAITLTAANQFNGKTVALNTSGGSAHASLSGQALKFATSTIGGTLTANASNGGISQSGAISTGAAGNSFSVSTGQSIDLSTQANSLAGLVNGSCVQHAGRSGPEKPGRHPARQHHGQRQTGPQLRHGRHQPDRRLQRGRRRQQLHRQLGRPGRHPLVGQCLQRQDDCDPQRGGRQHHRRCTQVRQQHHRGQAHRHGYEWQHHADRRAEPGRRRQQLQHLRREPGHHAQRRQPLRQQHGRVQQQRRHQHHGRHAQVRHQQHRRQAGRHRHQRQHHPDRRADPRRRRQQLHHVRNQPGHHTERRQHLRQQHGRPQQQR